MLTRTKLVGGAVLAAAALSLAACSNSEQTSSGTTTSPPAPTTTSSTKAPMGNGVTTPADVFGPACGQLPQGDAPGGLTAMGPQPVATAASTNPLLTKLVAAVKA